ncbi:MAG TPA: ATP-binding protein [Candidatus Acidoferrum sp.]|nr:ATP-binding protein [Candidatus Acidoferrum sp.]
MFLRSIKHKLLLITIVSSSAALLMVATAFFLVEYLSFRAGMQADLSTLAQIVGDQSTAALTYNDQPTAVENLRALASKKAGIEAACLYTNNSVFVAYQTSIHDPVVLPPRPGAEGWRFKGDHLEGFQSIWLNGERIGTIYVRSDLREMHLMLWRYVLIILIFIFGSLLAAYLLASRLQRAILRSVSHLAHTAREVSTNKNYSIRAVKESDDELGGLIDGFNGMLAQIQARDRALNEVNDKLEKRVGERTADLQQQLDRISLLNQITIAVAARQDSENIVLVVLQQLELNLPMDFSSAYWFDDSTGTFKVMACGAKSAQLAKRMPVLSGMALADTAFQMCVEGETIYLPDLSESPCALARAVSRVENFSLLGVPLFLDGRMLGLLLFLRRKLDGFAPAEREFIQSLSTHVALAVRQAQLYQDLQTAYNELHKTQQAVMQHERLKALGQMASGIAHDINNALSPIVGFSELLLRIETTITADGRKYLNYIKTAGEDISHIVAGLKEFYRLRDENESLLPLNLNQLVNQVIDMTRPRWRDLPQRRGTMIEMQKDLAPELPELFGMESEIREALTNLILNAVDAMPSGGTLLVRSRAGQSVVILEVCDTGIGMDETIRKRCLEPFFSTKGKRGTGLGLAMVYGIMERHEGRIDIDSAPGKGTTMRLIFPVPRTAAAAAPAADTNGQSGPFHILCIDDEPTVRTLMSEMLRHDGHEVETADSGRSGLNAFETARASGKPFDVVITDLGMPHMDGREVATALKHQNPKTPVFMLTGWGDFMKEDSGQPVDAILAKPPRIQEIRNLLREISPELQAKS